MFNMIVCLTWLGIVGGLLYFAFSRIRHDRAVQEAEYWQQECAMLQYENQFFRGLEQRLVPRLLQQFGADFQDFMIERTLRQHSGITIPALPPAQREMTIQTYNPTRSPKGYNISDSKFVQPNDEADEADDLAGHWDFETEYSNYRHTEARREPLAQRSTQSDPNNANRIKTLPFGAKPQPQAPMRSNRIHSIKPIMQPIWQDDAHDDVIDAEYIEIPVLPFKPPENSTPQPRKGGRPKKYATAAERQAAYRARQVH